MLGKRGGRYVEADDLNMQIEEVNGEFFLDKWAGGVWKNIAVFKNYDVALAARQAIRNVLEQPAVEPVSHQFQDSNGKWCDFIDERHYENTLKDGRWPIRALYTAPQAQQPSVEPASIDWISLNKAADEIVRSKSTWKRFIDGTPLANDIACWMADFALEYAAPQTQQPKTISELQAHIDAQVRDKPCNPHPVAPHGFDRTASHTENRYVCRCEYWEPDGYKPTENEGSEP